MSVVTIEEKGGFVGAGMPGGHVHTRGEMAWGALSQGDQASLDALFAAKKPVNALYQIWPAFSQLCPPIALAALVKARLGTPLE